MDKNPFFHEINAIFIGFKVIKRNLMKKIQLFSFLDIKEKERSGICDYCKYQMLIVS